MPFKYREPIDRIMANSVVSDTEGMMVRGEWSPCWIWVGKTRLGNRGKRYGAISTRFKNGPRKGKVRIEAVHRYVLREIKGRKLTPRSVGMHLCNVSLCCHPDHLGGGTQKANVRQCVNEGRHRNRYGSTGNVSTGG